MSDERKLRPVRLSSKRIVYLAFTDSEYRLFQQIEEAKARFIDCLEKSNLEQRSIDSDCSELQNQLRQDE